MAKTYICSACKGEFEFVPEANERAHEEALKLFGRDGNADDMDIVCDDCYPKIMAYAKANDFLGHA